VSCSQLRPSGYVGSTIVSDDFLDLRTYVAAVAVGDGREAGPMRRRRRPGTVPVGVVSVEAGLIASPRAFRQPCAEVVASVLANRLMGFWLPAIPEALAYVQLRRSGARWVEAPLEDQLP
jgi:hypothetical protein